MVHSFDKQMCPEPPGCGTPSAALPVPSRSILILGTVLKAFPSGGTENEWCPRKGAKQQGDSCRRMCWDQSPAGCWR